MDSLSLIPRTYIMGQNTSTPTPLTPLIANAVGADRLILLQVEHLARRCAPVKALLEEAEREQKALENQPSNHDPKAPYISPVHLHIGIERAVKNARNSSKKAINKDLGQKLVQALERDMAAPSFFHKPLHDIATKIGTDYRGRRVLKAAHEMMTEVSESTMPVVEAEFPDDALYNIIHPLYSRENWKVDEETYKLMEPALCLASRLLTCERSMKWFEQVATGALKPHPSKPDATYFEVNSELTARQKRDAVVKAFAKLQNHLNFFVRDLREDTSESKQRWGSAQRIQWYDPHTEALRQVSISIFIDEDIVDFIADQEPDTTAFETWTFWLANILCHEMAHAVGYEFSWETCIEEPYYHLDEKFHELGHSWNLAVLGNDYRPCVSRCRYLDGPFALRSNNALHMGVYAAEDMPLLLFHGVTDPIVLGTHFVVASWIRKWFLESTWERIAQEGINILVEEAAKYKVVTKNACPYTGWTTHYIETPDGRDEVPAIVCRVGIDLPIRLTLRRNPESGRWVSVC
jgi:hypothetical protein